MASWVDKSLVFDSVFLLTHSLSLFLHSGKVKKHKHKKHHNEKSVSVKNEKTVTVKKEQPSPPKVQQIYKMTTFVRTTVLSQQLHV